MEFQCVQALAHAGHLHSERRKGRYGRAGEQARAAAYEDDSRLHPIEGGRRRGMETSMVSPKQCGLMALAVVDPSTTIAPIKS